MVGIRFYVALSFRVMMPGPGASSSCVVDVCVFTVDMLFTEIAGSWHRVCFGDSCPNGWMEALVIYCKFLT